MCLIVLFKIKIKQTHRQCDNLTKGIIASKHSNLSLKLHAHELSSQNISNFIDFSFVSHSNAREWS